MTIAIIDIQYPNGMQAIRIPKDMHINDDKVYLKKVGNTIQIIPYHSAWQSLIDSLQHFTPDFMETRNQPQ
jgi:antitoxin VapB